MQKVVLFKIKYCECKYNLYLRLKKRSFLNFYEKRSKKNCSGSNRRELITRYSDLTKPASHRIWKSKLKIEWLVLVIKFFKTRVCFDHERSFNIYLDSLHMLICFCTNESHIPNKISGIVNCIFRSHNVV